MRLNKKWLALGMACLVFAGVGLGAGFLATRSVLGTEEPAEAAISSDRLIYRSNSMTPGWDKEAMVKRSDAVVIGKFVADLGDKQVGGGTEDLGVASDFKDYEFIVEEALYPDDMGVKIALLVHTGLSGPDGVFVSGAEELLDWQLDEKVLVFLENLEGKKYEGSAARPVPKGFTPKTYYRVILGGKYNKLVPDGDGWKDTTSRQKVSLDDIKESIEQQKDSAAPAEEDSQ